MPHHYLTTLFDLPKWQVLVHTFHGPKHIRDIALRVVSMCFFNTPGVKMDGEYTPEEVDLPTGCLKPLHGICTHVLCWTIIGLPKFEQTLFFVMVKKPHVVSTTNLRSRTSNPGLQFSGDGNSTQGFQFGSKGQPQDLSETSTTSIPHHESVCFLGGSESMGFIPILESPFWEHIFGTLSKDLMLIWDHHGSLDNKPLSHSFEYLLEEGRLSAWRIL